MPTLQQHIAANRTRILTREAAIAAGILAAFQQAQRSITPAEQHLVDAYAAQMQRLQAQQDAQAESDGEEPSDVPPVRVPPSWLASNPTTRHLQSAILFALASFALTSRLSITDGQAQAVRAGAEDAHGLIVQALQPLTVHLDMVPIEQAIRTVPHGVLDAFIGRSMATGKPLADLLDSLGPFTADKVTKALYSALTTGAHPTVAARAIRDTTGMAYRRALVISRNEMVTAYRSSALATYRANSDVVSGWTWLAAADACPFCLEMNGTHHTLDEDLSAMTHVQCRCAMSPDTRPLSDLLTLFAA